MEHVESTFCFGSETWSWSHATLGQNQKMGNSGDESSISFQNKEDETWANSSTRTAQGCQENIGKDDFTFSVRSDC